MKPRQTNNLTGRALLDHLIGLHDAGLPLPSVAGGEPTEAEKAAGGGAVPASAAAPAAPAVPPDLAAEFAALRAQVMAFQSAEALRQEETRRQAQQDLIQKGKLDEIAKNHETQLKSRDDQFAALLERTRKAELTRSLSEALSGHELRDGAMGQLQKLWGDEFEVWDAPDGSFKVRSKTDLREPKAVVAERLASKEFDHFLRATSRGGSGAATAQAQAAGTQAEASASSSPFEVLRRAAQDYQKSIPGRN